MLEVVETLTTAVQDVTYGVNALLSAIPRKTGHAVPPAITAFLNDAEDGVLTRKRLPKDTTTPALVLFDEGVTWDVGVTQNLRRGTASVGLAYLRQDSADSALMNRDSHYTLRALRRCLDHFDPSQTTLRTIALEELLAIEEGLLSLELGDVTFSSGMRVKYAIRDTAPLG